MIPKSVHADRIKENIDVFGFILNDGDVESIDTLDTGRRHGPDPGEPLPDHIRDRTIPEA